MARELTEKQKKTIRSQYKKQTARQLAKALRVDIADVEAYIETLSAPLDPRKQRMFTILLIAIPFLFILLLELGLQIFQYGGNLNLFLSGEGDIRGYYHLNPDVGKRYFFMQQSVPAPSKDLLRKEKGKNTFRIFVLGGSTTAGFPYGNNLCFPRILNHRLAETFPDLDVELVNAAMSAVCSYTVLDLLDEILDQDPDLLLIYAGHNEFYGAMGVASMESLGKNPAFVRGYLKLRKFKLFILMRDIVAGLRKATGKAVTASSEANPTATLMERIVGEQHIPMGSAIYEKGKEQFRQNLQLIFQKCSEAKVPVMVSELVSNVRDQKPFESSSEGGLPPADQVYQEAQKSEQSEAWVDAQDAYYRAKDLDVLRFRATEEFNQIIRQMGKENRMPVVPMRTVFENASPNGLIGDNLMTDHLHPNINGYFLMAETFLEAMKSYQLILDQWPEIQTPQLSEIAGTWGMTSLDSTAADLAVQYLRGGWPFQSRNTPNRSLENFKPADASDRLAFRSVTDDEFSLATAHYELAQHYEEGGKTKQAIREYRALTTMVPQEKLFNRRLANLLILEKNYQAAEPVLRRSLKIGESYFANKWLGQILLVEGKPYEAIPYLERAIRMQTPDAQSLFNLSRAYLKISEIKSAKLTADELNRLFPGSRYLGSLAREQKISIGNLKEISDPLKQAQQQMQAEKWEEAGALLLKVIGIQENRPANEMLAQIYINRRNVADALPIYEKLKYYSPGNPGILYQLAGLYVREGRPFKARAMLLELQKLQPEFEDPLELKMLLDPS